MITPAPRHLGLALAIVILTMILVLS